MSFFHIISVYYLISYTLYIFTIALGFILFCLYKSKNKELQKTISNLAFENLISNAILGYKECNKENLFRIMIELSLITLIPGVGIFANVFFICILLSDILINEKNLSTLLKTIP